MIKIAVTGTTGRMGKEVIAAINSNKDLTVVDYLTGTDVFDVLIDFTAPSAIHKHLEHCVKLSRPMVIGTTGLGEVEKKALQAAVIDIPIVIAPNMSIGVNVCYHLLEACAKALGKNWQVAISEVHHKYKKDAPSGTALKMGEIVEKYAGIEQDFIQFNSIRAGDVVGEHTVSFIGDGERIEITHKASNRQAFAQGAVLAARWVVGKEPGLYSMQDVIQDSL